jgi:hypothetical protein
MAYQDPPRNTPIVDVRGYCPENWAGWFQGLAGGFTGTITTAALTGLGAQGSMTFRNGILVSQQQAT